MADTTKLPKFRPNRAIYLSTSNTGYKTQIEVELAVEKLRSKNWLCALHSDESAPPPIHFAFDNEQELAEFKKACSDLGVVLKSPLIKPDEIDSIENIYNPSPIKQEVNKDYEDPQGKIHVEL